ncbi:sugar phosphate isomerase/epimerase family protein [Candidatus Soleaferrea massiliensis]|uniref:sugar phosphate isomerase/epimerase family protein n=1 Tax=Candidatus Soleaferrea massiliensis TaxID=1470354 RepID=UPI00058EF2FF|nr:sugar phosphate isomerase/epimerase [Candidatus Soleaferrea massiliensis]
MELGISTACLYPMQVEQALETLCKSGVKTVEIFFNAPSELHIPYLKQLKIMADIYGVHVKSLHPFTSEIETLFFFTNYERRFRDALDIYKRYFEAANILGSDLLVFHGEKNVPGADQRENWERFRTLYHTGASFGVTVAQENVARCKSHDLSYIRGMREYLGEDVSFVLDSKQAIRSGVKFYDLLDAMGKNIAHIHISDFTENADCLPPGEGTFDFESFFAKMHDNSYHGGIIIELYRNNFQNLQDLIASYDYLLTKNR